MASEDLATYIETTQKFLVSCCKIQPSAEDMATALVYNMVVAPKVRGFLRGRRADYDHVPAESRCPCS